MFSPTAAFMNMENMTSVVEETGGDLIKGHDPGADFEEMIRRLRLRYMLVYALPQGKPGQPRRIKVELSEDAQKKNPQARVQGSRWILSSEVKWSDDQFVKIEA